MDSRDKEVRTTVSILVFSIIAGSAFLFTKQASATIPAATLTAFRLTLGSISLLTTYTIMYGYTSLLFTFQYELFGNWLSIKKICYVGILNTVIPYTLYAIASENGIDVSIQAIMSGISPIFVAFLSYIYIPDMPSILNSKNKLFGLFLCICGSCLITLHEEIVSGEMSESSIIGILAQFLAVICKSSAAVLAEHTFKYHNINMISNNNDMSNHDIISNHPNSNSNSCLLTNDDEGCDKLTMKDEKVVNMNVPSYDRMSSPSFAMGQACIGAIIAIPLAVIWDFILIPSRGSPLLSNDDNNDNDNNDGDDNGSFDWIQVVVPILYLGIISSCFVYYLQFYIVKQSSGLRQILSVDSLTPVVGVIEGAIFNCDFCDINYISKLLSILGAILCILGVILFQLSYYDDDNQIDKHVSSSTDGEDIHEEVHHEDFYDVNNDIYDKSSKQPSRKPSSSLTRSLLVDS